MENYNKEALDFLNATSTALTIKFKTFGDHFNDGVIRSIFRCGLKNKLGSYYFDFGQSVSEGSSEPTAYSILSCLQKYDVGSFEDFCSEFGYYEGSKRATKIYKAVCREYEGISKLFNNEQIESLAEIN